MEIIRISDGETISLQQDHPVIFYAENATCTSIVNQTFKISYCPGTSCMFIVFDGTRIIPRWEIKHKEQVESRNYREPMRKYRENY